jgi:ribosome-associated protein
MPVATERKGTLRTQTLPRTSATAPRSVSRSRPDAAETLRIVLERLDEMKAEDIVTIDLTGKTAIADAMVVASGRSNRHVGSIADNVTEALHQAGLKDLRTEGQPHCDWVLLDAGDVIVHVFRPEVREFYNIEKMWSGDHRSNKRAS